MGYLVKKIQELNEKFGYDPSKSFPNDFDTKDITNQDLESLKAGQMLLVILYSITISYDSNEEENQDYGDTCRGYIAFDNNQYVIVPDKKPHESTQTLYEMEYYAGEGEFYRCPGGEDGVQVFKVVEKQ